MAGQRYSTRAFRPGRGWVTRGLTLLTLFFLTLPLLVLMVYSFNGSRVATLWEGFSLKWYAAVIQDQGLWEAAKNSLIIALSNTAISLVLGTMAALALGRYRFRGNLALTGILHIPMILPEIIFGMSLLMLFVALNLGLGFGSIIIAHATFSIPFVAVEVLAKVRAMDPDLEAAGLDLGATPWQAFWTVVLPQIFPGMTAGALFAFTMSLDDFVITYFTAGSGITTLPLRIYSMVKTGMTPAVNAVSTILILVTILVILAVGRLKQSKRLGLGMRLALGAGGAAALIFAGVLVFQDRPDRGALYISNYSEYLSKTLVKKFQDQTGIQVFEDFYSSNEELLAKMQMKAVQADLVVVSDYMVRTMIRQGHLAALEPRRIPNMRFIMPRFRHPDWDPAQAYHVPYTYGFTGIAYNPAIVPQKPRGWHVLSDPRFSRKIMLLDDMIEVMDIGFRLNRHKIGDMDPQQLDLALNRLAAVKSGIKKFSSTLAADYLAAGEVALAQTWNGNFYALKKDHPKFEFIVPEEGAFSFVDTFCIPRHARNKANAHKFINFMLRPENTAINMTEIFYLMPNTRAMPLVDDKTRALLESARDRDHKTGPIPELDRFKPQLEKAWTRFKSQGSPGGAPVLK